MTRLTFKKNERLTNKKTFEELFNTGKSFTAAPFRLVWVDLTPSPSPKKGEGSKKLHSSPVQLGISVPKRSFAKAVDRNTLKRRIREAYRKNKHVLYGVLQKENLSIALMIIYIAKEEVSYREIEHKMVVSLQRLAAQKHT